MTKEKKKKHQSRKQSLQEIAGLGVLVLLPAIFTGLHLFTQRFVFDGVFPQLQMTVFDLPAYLIAVVIIAIVVARYFTIRIRDSRLYGVWFVYLVLVTCFSVLIWSMSGFRFRVDDELTIGTTTYFAVNAPADNIQLDFYVCENRL